MIRSYSRVTLGAAGLLVFFFFHGESPLENYDRLNGRAQHQTPREN
jgi:hypothetical protein